MTNDGLKDLILEVISSWQVIVVTVVVLLYIFFVNFVSRDHYRRNNLSQPKVQKVKVKAKAKTKPKKDSSEEVTDDSELGLE